MIGMREKFANLKKLTIDFGARVSRGVDRFFKKDADRDLTDGWERLKSLTGWTIAAAVGFPFLAIGALFGAFSGGFIGNGFGLVGAIVGGLAFAAIVGIALVGQLVGIPIWLTIAVLYFGACLTFGLAMSQPNDKK